MRNLTAMLIGAQLHRADNDVRESGAELGGGGNSVRNNDIKMRDDIGWAGDSH